MSRGEIMGFIDNADASYDKLAKQILSRKVILSRILKHCVPEFAECTLEDIENKYIEGEAKINMIPLDDTIQVGRVEVGHQQLTLYA